jgi:poly-gamma-glutamate capsule biosynthesis protein CapA/YwtB (metallophosphatase superfamily)
VSQAFLCVGLLSVVVACGEAPSEVGETPDAVQPASPELPATLDPATLDPATLDPAGTDTGVTITDHDDDPRGFTIAASGDLLIHGPVRRQAATYGERLGEAFDFRPMFDQVRPVFADADLAICHLEVPLSADNSRLSGYPLFSAPRELAEAIAHAGFDACSTASNHSMDQGGDGATQTLDLLDDAGVGHAGMARTEHEAETVSTHTLDDVDVAHLSYTYGLNGMPLPPNAPWMVDLIDEDRILADAERAREAGAEFVVASMHWGVEYQQTPSAEQRHLAETMLAEGGVDLILGHHAHVVQPVTTVEDRYAVNGLGNFLSNQSSACCPTATQDGAIVVIEVEEVDDGLVVTDLTYVPTWVDRDDYTIVDVGAELGDPALPEDRRETLTASWDRTVAAITAEGADGLGVEPRRTPHPGSSVRERTRLAINEPH